jgi:hypothetical protein
MAAIEHRANLPAGAGGISSRSSQPQCGGFVPSTNRTAFFRRTKISHDLVGRRASVGLFALNLIGSGKLRYDNGAWATTAAPLYSPWL